MDRGPRYKEKNIICIANTLSYSRALPGVNMMQRNSNCFDLASVLIKPVQRILKYPLLINELDKATEESHPDKQHLLRAMDEMAKVIGVDS